jgi:integrase
VPLYKRPGSDVWYLDIRRGRSGRIRRSARTTDRAKAQRQHDELANRLWKQKQSGKQLSDALLAWVKARPRGGSDLRMLKQIRSLYKDRPLADVTEASMIEALGDKTPATYNRMTTIVRASLNMAERAAWIDRAPAIKRRKVPGKSFRWLTRAEWKKLRAELANHLRPMADFAIATGLRWGNVAGLTWEQIDMKAAKAWIGAGEAKGRKAIAIPLSEAALTVLRARPRPRKGLVFPYDGEALGSPKTGWSAAVKRAGIKPVRWHDLRHTWASWHVQNETPLLALKELGGWSSLEQVMIYAHLAPSHLAKYANNSAA